MSELKAFNCVDSDLQEFCEPRLVYLKSEADKVIAKLEEKLDTTEKLLNKALDCISNGKNHMMSLARKNNHANYKRCLAMAKLCQWKMGVFIYKKEKNELYYRWYKRYLAIAEKFKEAK